MVVDYRDGAISIIDGRDLVEGLHREIQDLAGAYIFSIKQQNFYIVSSDQDVEILGTEIEDSAYDENLDIREHTF